MTTPPAVLDRAVDSRQHSNSAEPQNRGSVRFLGAMAFLLELDRSLSPYYWLNINDATFPFLAVVEHTRMIDPGWYGGRHLVYVGNYLPTSDPRYTQPADRVLQNYLPHLKRIQPAFDPAWIVGWHVARSPHAQPVVDTSYHQEIPPHRTQLPGVVLATMAQVYPYDRGQNYAVAMARSIVKNWPA